MRLFKISTSILLFLFTVFQVQSVDAQQLNELKMTVDELAESIKKNNIQLQLADALITVADARIGEAKNNRLPDIGADMQAFYLSDINLYDTSWNQIQNVDIPNFGHQFNITASQLIFAGGKVNRAIALSEMNKTLSEIQSQDTEQLIKLKAAELYLNLYNLQNQKIILEGNTTLAQERSKKAKDYYEEDMITKNELLRSQVLERQLDQSILQIQNAILITNKNLKLLAGITEDVMIIPDFNILNVKIEDEDEAFYRAMAFQNNPQLAATSTQVEMAEKSLQITKADRLPTLAGFAGYNANRPQTGSPALDLYANNYQVGLNLSYNIETLFKNRKIESVDKALITEAILAKEAVRQEVEAEVNAAYKSYHQAIEQLEVSAINEEAAAENYRITELKYNSQLVIYIEIIDAANIKLQAELKTLEDKTNIILNYLKLLRITGQL